MNSGESIHLQTIKFTEEGTNTQEIYTQIFALREIINKENENAKTILRKYGY